MSKAPGQPLPSALKQIVNPLVDGGIRINAMEQVLVKTNSVTYPLYLGTIENLQRQKEPEVNRMLTQTLKSKPTKR